MKAIYKREEIFKGKHADTAPAVTIPGLTGPIEEATVSDTEADEMEEHLRGLGYLE